MKLRNYLLLALILAFSAPSNAQFVGIRAGANMSNFSGDVMNTERLVGFQFGPVLEVNVGERSALSLAALLSSKGSKDGISDVTTDLSYVEVPLLFQSKFGNFFIELGPSFGYMITADIGGESAKDLFKDFDLALLGGAGINLGSIQADIRYSFGVLNIWELTNDDIRNGMLTGGVTIFLGK